MAKIKKKNNTNHSRSNNWIFTVREEKLYLQRKFSDMIPEGWIQYKVEVLKDKYLIDNKEVAPATALISFFNKNGQTIGQIKKGYFTKDELYAKISNGEQLILNSCYISNFSMSEYRKIRGLQKEEFVDINGFSAIDSVFDAVIANDFSYVRFGNEAVNFKESYFLQGKTIFQGSYFEKGNVNFGHCRFINGEFDFSQADLGEGGIVFNGTLFGEGFKDFNYTKFGDRDVSFVAVEFGPGDVSFINSTYGDVDISFSRAVFGEGLVDFHFIHFHKGTINFERTQFGKGKVDFHMVEFDNCKVNFNRSEFGDGDLNFEACVMNKGKLQFKNADFGNGDINFEQIQMEDCEALFDKASFGTGKISFYSSEFKTLSLKSCQMNSYFDFRVKKCDYLDLSGTIIRDVADMTPYEFDVKIGCLNITGMRLIGQINLEWKKNNVKTIIYNNKDAGFASYAEQFRNLKQNFNKTGRYDDEDLAYIEFKRNEAKAALKSGIKDQPYSVVWRYPLYYIKYLLFDSMGLYATSPMRTMISVVVTLFIFSFIQFLLPFIADTSPGTCLTENASSWLRFWETFYYSGVSFFTIGYGDCSPVGVLRYVSVIEGFVGVFMMSYFTVAFARKVLR